MHAGAWEKARHVGDKASQREGAYGGERRKTMRKLTQEITAIRLR
jgi:hypothetical protein